jgi:hypothetical protein
VLILHSFHFKKVLQRIGLRLFIFSLRYAHAANGYLNGKMLFFQLTQQAPHSSLSGSGKQLRNISLLASEVLLRRLRNKGMSLCWLFRIFD